LEVAMNNTQAKDFKNDLIARRVIRFLLLFQLFALLIGIIFTLTHIYSNKNARTHV